MVEAALAMLALAIVLMFAGLVLGALRRELPVRSRDGFGRH